MTPDQLEMWGRIWPDAINTGILTRGVPTLDVDILNEKPLVRSRTWSASTTRRPDDS